MINKNFNDWINPDGGTWSVTNEKVYVKSSISDSTAFKYDLLTNKGDEYILKLKVKVVSGCCVVKFSASSTNSTVYDTQVINNTGTHIIKTVVPNRGEGTMCVHIGSPVGYEGEFEIYDICDEIKSFTQKLECYAKFKVRVLSDGTFYKSNSYDSVNVKIDKCNYDSSTSTINLCIKCNALQNSKRPTVIINASNEHYANSKKLYIVNTIANYFDSEGDLIIPLKLIELTDNFRVGLPKDDVFLSCIVI